MDDFFNITCSKVKNRELNDTQCGQGAPFIKVRFNFMNKIIVKITGKHLNFRIS